jgi:signal peptidase II
LTTVQRAAGVRIAAVALAVVAVDQLTKAWVVRTLGPDQPNHRRDLLGSWFSLEYVQNRGTAFGLFGGGGPFVLSLVAFGFVILAIAVRRISRPSTWFLLAAGLVAGGAIGNAIDRVRIGHVTDFIAVSVWWRFNIADSAVTIGVLILVWLSMHARIEREDG